MSHLTFARPGLSHENAFRNNSDLKHHNNQNNSAKVNNKIGDNETVVNTSPEMKKVCNLMKNTPSSSAQLMKNSNCLPDETVTPAKGDKSKLSKQSGQNSVSAFKPFGGISNESPTNNVHAQHPQHAEVS